MPENDRTLGLIDALIDDLKDMRTDYVTITKVGHSQHVARDDASDRQSVGSHSDATGAVVTDMAACRRYTETFRKEIRRAVVHFQNKAGPAYEALHRAFRAADRRSDERLDNRIRY